VTLGSKPVGHWFHSWWGHWHSFGLIISTALCSWGLISRYKYGYRRWRLQIWNITEFIPKFIVWRKFLWSKMYRTNLKIKQNLLTTHSNACHPQLLLFVIVAPCVLICLGFTHKQMYFYYFRKHIKIYIKLHINIAPTCFDLPPPSASLHWTWLKLYLC
jgi:hypothetical protein